MREQFEVNGFFYEEKGYKCRKYLDIKRVNSLTSTPDIMVVMMNPGSSYPLDKIDNNTIPSVAVPDKTQDQIMKVMNSAGFNYARILNLSDLRTPKSSALYKFLKSEESKSFPHSIFNVERKREFKSLFIEDVPVIYGWGVNSSLNSLAELAVKTINRDDAIGLKKLGNEYSYYHPLPQVFNDQIEWVNKITSLMKKIK